MYTREERHEFAPFAPSTGRLIDRKRYELKRKECYSKNANKKIEAPIGLIQPTNKINIHILMEQKVMVKNETQPQ